MLYLSMWLTERKIGLITKLNPNPCYSALVALDPVMRQGCIQRFYNQRFYKNG
jgi:hypothetical protein